MSQVYDNESLYKHILELDVIDKGKLEECRVAAQQSGQALGEVLLDKDLISDDNLARIVAELISKPLVRLSGLAIDEDVLMIVPEVTARSQRIVAFAKDAEGLKLAMANPNNEEIIQFLAKKTGEKVVPYYASERDIELALGFYKRNLQKSYDELLKEQVNAVGKGADKDAPVAKIVTLLVEYAYANRASDIHIEPEKKISVVRFRIDGVLHDVLQLNKALHDQVISKVKVAAKLRTDEHLAAQDGKMQMSVPGEDLDIRVSVVPVVHGEKAVLRLLSSKARQLSLRDLGMSGEDLQKIENGYNRPFGMVLATGPTGCGKTTTIYTMLKALNVREINIASIEDPVEYDIEGINQIQVNPKTNLTFASGLRAILRQDPNAIFVGEIRDPETADIAVNSAMTGHLVLSTLHTNDAATTLPRLMEMGVEPFLVAATVNVIVGQRLVRRVCTKCRTSKEVESGKLKTQSQIPAELVDKYLGAGEMVRVYYGKGCSVCQNTGYLGRVGIFEVLVVSPTIKEMLVDKVDSAGIRKQAIKEGMATMLEDGLLKVQEGITTIEEIIRATKE